jgi:hypothetical protein
MPKIKTDTRARRSLQAKRYLWCDPLCQGEATVPPCPRAPERGQVLLVTARMSQPVLKLTNVASGWSNTAAFTLRPRTVGVLLGRAFK